MESASGAGAQGRRLDPLVVVATRGRAVEVYRLLEDLAVQELLPTLVVVVGAVPADLPAIDPLWPFAITLLISDMAGLTRQRNRGLAALLDAGLLSRPNHFVAFFDDDFRPASEWLRAASDAFAADLRLVGLTGQVLADGIKGEAITEREAQAILSGVAPPRPHWSSGHVARPVESLYGCNMAVTAAVAARCSFDEGLPLYGWQEDCDFTGQARKLGDTRIVPACRGVHLGVKSARTSGVRLGYSQIANPIQIAKRGNMTRLRMVRFLGLAILANVGKALLRQRPVDYPGRLRGNLRALSDLVHGRCSPDRVLTLKG